MIYRRQYLALDHCRRYAVVIYQPDTPLMAMPLTPSRWLAHPTIVGLLAKPHDDYLACGRRPRLLSSESATVRCHWFLGDTEALNQLAIL